MTFHMPDSWYEPEDEHDCPDDPDECQCEERAEDARDAALMARDDADHGR